MQGLCSAPAKEVLIFSLGGCGLQRGRGRLWDPLGHARRAADFSLILSTGTGGGFRVGSSLGRPRTTRFRGTGGWGLIEPFSTTTEQEEAGSRRRRCCACIRWQAWFSPSDEGAEDAVYDWMRRGRSWGWTSPVEQAPDATTPLGLRHLTEKYGLGKKLFEAQNDDLL